MDCHSAHSAARAGGSQLKMNLSGAQLDEQCMSNYKQRAWKGKRAGTRAFHRRSLVCDSTSKFATCATCKATGLPPTIGIPIEVQVRRCRAAPLNDVVVHARDPGLGHVELHGVHGLAEATRGKGSPLQGQLAQEKDRRPCSYSRATTPSPMSPWRQTRPGATRPSAAAHAVPARQDSHKRGATRVSGLHDLGAIAWAVKRTVRGKGTRHLRCKRKRHAA